MRLRRVGFGERSGIWIGFLLCIVMSTSGSDGRRKRKKCYALYDYGSLGRGVKSL